MALTKIEDETITNPSVATIVIPLKTCGGLPCPWAQVESPFDRWPQAAVELGGRGYGRARHFFSVGATIQPDAIIFRDPGCRQEDLTCTVTTTPKLLPSWDWSAPTAKPSKPCHDGADAVMLSAESAADKYLIDVVRMMSGIIAPTETDPYYREIIDASHTPPQAEMADAIGCAMRRGADPLRFSAPRIVRERPKIPIIGMAPRLATARRLTLVWGMHAVLTHKVANVLERTEFAGQAAPKEGFAQTG